MARQFDPDTARTILAIERKVWLYAGLKEQRVRADLDVTMTRYYQMLNALLDTELTLQLDAITTKRLRARRERLQRSRSVRRTA